MAEPIVVSDGTLVLVLEPAEEGGFVVSCPHDRALNTQAETVAEAFENAYDALELLGRTRADLARELAESGTLREADPGAA